MKKTLFSLAALIVSSYNFAATDNRIQMPPAETIRASLSKGEHPKLIAAGLHTELGDKLLTPGQVIACIMKAKVSSGNMHALQIDSNFALFLGVLCIPEASRNSVMAAATNIHRQ